MSVGAAMTGAGFIIQGWGEIEQANAQAKAEEMNAGFYREEAAFAYDTGQRQLETFGHESEILLGEQGSAFAKAGVDTAASANFIGNNALMRQREAYSIKREADMNVRLATLRAEHSEVNANNMRESGQWAALGSFMKLGGSLVGGG